MKAKDNVFSGSEIDSMHCERFWALRYGIGWEQERQPMPFVIGKLWHEIVEAAWNGSPDLSDFKAAKDRLWDIRARLEEESEFSGLEVGDVFMTLQAMLDVWMSQANHHLRGFSCVANEMVFEMPVRNGRNLRLVGIYSGKVDRVLEDKHGQLWINESKTTATLPASWERTHFWHPQRLRYAVAVENALGRPVVGVVHDVVRKFKWPEFSDFKVLKDGKTLSKVIPANTRHCDLVKAIGAYGFDSDLHSEHLEKCVQWETPFDEVNDYCGIFAFRFTDEQKAATRKSLVRSAERIASLSKKVDAAISNVSDYEFSDVGISLAAIGAVTENGAQCANHFGRPCPFVGVCQYRNAEAFNGLRRTTSKHEELEVSDEGR